jgi:hypothetical protein
MISEVQRNVGSSMRMVNLWWRRLWREQRDMRVRHARERAMLTAWRIEVIHLIEQGDDETP